MDFYKSDIPIIDTDSPSTVQGMIDLAAVNGYGRGYVPRDYDEFPETFMASASEMKTYEPSEWDALYDEQEAQQSSLEHIFLRGGVPAFVNLDQNRDGDCWAYSTGHAKMFADLRDFGSCKRLNPHFIATYLKRFDGGWCGASAKVLAEVGCLEEGNGPDQWPLWSHDTGLLNNTRMVAATANRSTEEWRDLTKKVYDQTMTTRQIATCGFQNVPVPQDFNHMSHSVCGIRWVRIERSSWGPLLMNSWKNWGRHGLFVLRGSKAIADGAVGIRY